jgi:hypothetical protein
MAHKKTFVQHLLFQCILVFMVACIVGISVFQKEININGDNACYICYAKSLAAGEGFRLANHPQKPKSDQYPLLFPLFLAVFIKIFGYHLLLLKSAMLVVFGLSMVIFFLIARRVLQGKLLLGIMALVLTNFWLLDNSSIVMSELTFMLCLLAGYLLLVRFEETDIIKFMGFAGLLFILSVFVRTIGISVFLTVFAYLILKKQYRLLAGLTLAFVVLYFVNKSFMQPKSNYLTDLFKVNPYQPHLGSVGFVGFFKRIWDNTLF